MTPFYLSPLQRKEVVAGREAARRGEPEDERKSYAWRIGWQEGMIILEAKQRKEAKNEKR